MIVAFLASPDYVYHTAMMLKANHCNPDHPRNRNIAVTSLASPFMHVYEDGEWDVVQKKRMLMNILDKYDERVDAAFRAMGKDNLASAEQEALANYTRFRDRWHAPTDELFDEMVACAYKNRKLVSR